jgi:hypothetical protein
VPSFRVTMTIGALRPGVSPEVVLPTAARIAATLSTVEASSVDVVSGSARITVRFTADTATDALRIAAQVASGTGDVAEVITWLATERVGGRWYPRR